MYWGGIALACRPAEVLHNQLLWFEKRSLTRTRLVGRDILDLSSQLPPLLLDGGQTETILRRDTVTQV